MGTQALGGSWAAQRYCHSDARISAQVSAEQGGLFANRAMTTVFTFWISSLESSYSHSDLSTSGGGTANRRAISRSTRTVVPRPLGCTAALYTAFSCSEAYW